MKRKTFVLLTLLATLGPASAEAADPRCLTAPGSLSLAANAGYPSSTLYVEAAPDPVTWLGDDFVITIHASPPPHAVEARMPFSSTYGKFELCVEDLTGDGVDEFLLLHGKYRGTDVREEYLTVLRRQANALVSILDTQVSGFFGVGHWQYHRGLIDVNGDHTIDLRLVLEHTPVGDSSLNDPSLIPSEEVKEFIFNPAKGAMEQRRGTSRNRASSNFRLQAAVGGRAHSGQVASALVLRA